MLSSAASRNRWLARSRRPEPHIFNRAQAGGEACTNAVRRDARGELPPRRRQRARRGRRGAASAGSGHGGRHAAGMGGVTEWPLKRAPSAPATMSHGVLLLAARRAPAGLARSSAARAVRLQQRRRTQVEAASEAEKLLQVLQQRTAGSRLCCLRLAHARAVPRRGTPAEDLTLGVPDAIDMPHVARPATGEGAPVRGCSLLQRACATGVFFLRRVLSSRVLGSRRGVRVPGGWGQQCSCSYARHARGW